MKKIIIFMLCHATAGANLLLAQSDSCGHTSIKNWYADSFAKFKTNQNLFWHRLQEYRATNPQVTMPSRFPFHYRDVNPDTICRKIRYLIPVVVTIVHLPGQPVGSGSNITNAQVQNQIDALNKAFSNYNGKINGVNTGIQFCLAPTASAPYGIYRVASSHSNHRNNEIRNLFSLKDPALPFDKFVHIYVVNEILSPTGAATGIKGYATMPHSGADLQGIVVKANRFGEYGCAGCSSGQLHVASLGKTLIHEMGHFFGLLHTFENGCAGADSASCASEGDKCCDTPPVSVPNFTCSANSCHNDVPDLPDMTENFMDYTSDACRSRFSINQTEIMHFTLINYKRPLIDVRHTNTLNLSCCYYSARFSILGNSLCNPDTVKFEAIQYAYSPVKYGWTITKGSSTLLSVWKTNDYSLSWFCADTGSYRVTLKVVMQGDTITETVPGAVLHKDCGPMLASEQGNWFFGEYAGLSFRQNGVVANLDAYNPQTKTINTFEGCITQSDSAGNLLFYGGGNAFSSPFYIFDKRHVKIAPDFEGSGTTTQAALSLKIAPVRYLLLTNTADDLGYLHYSIFNTTLGAAGGIETGKLNLPLKGVSGSDFSSSDSAVAVKEMLSAIPACNPYTYWLLAVDGSSSSFANHQKILVFKVTPAAISFHSAESYQISDHQGNMKVSPDGNFFTAGGYLFRFNRDSGTISLLADFADTITNQFGTSRVIIYGSSFSPDSKFLYYLQTEANGYTSLIQMETTAGKPKQSRATIAIYPEDYFNSLQLGPDGKIYISRYAAPWLGVIHQPNQKCSPSNPNACDFVPDGISLWVGGIGGISSVGLPNMVDAQKPDSLPPAISWIRKNCTQVSFQSSICCKDSYKWLFGDGDSALYKNPVHTYNAPGFYNVTLIAGADTVVAELAITLPEVGISGLSQVCDTLSASEYLITPTPTDALVSWSAPNAVMASLPNQPDRMLIRWSAPATLTATVTDKYQCAASDSLAVIISTSISSNSISAPQYVCLHDTTATVSGSVASSIGTIKYKWLKQQGGSDWQLLPDTTQNLNIGKISSTTLFMRIAYDEFCQSESNPVTVHSFGPQSVSNSISAQIAYCKMELIGTSLSSISGIAYSWIKSPDSITWSTIAGANAKDYLTPDVKKQYRYARVASVSGCFDTSNAILDDWIFITQQPSDTSICADNVTGEFTLNLQLNTYYYQDGKVHWFVKRSGNWDSVTTITGLREDQTGSFTGLASDFNTQDTFMAIVVFGLPPSTCPDTLFSTIAILSKPDNSLSFISQPANQSVVSGTSALFSVQIDYNFPHAFTWQESFNNGASWSDIPNSDNDSLLIQFAGSCHNGHTFRVKITTACSTFFSDTANLHVSGIFPADDDLWMKDLWSDIGDEPHAAGLANWVQGVDVWVRHAPDGLKPANLHQRQPLFGLDTNYVYYTIRNKGTAPSSGGKLYLYWCWGATKEDWPVNWTENDQNYFHNLLNGQKYYQGGPVNRVAINIPTINPGDSFVAYFPWTEVPNPTAFYIGSGTNIVKINSISLCFLARIQTCDNAPFGMSFPEKTPIGYNVGSNNNIMSRNMAAYTIRPDGTTDLVNAPSGAFIPVTIRAGNQPSDVSSVCIHTPDIAYFADANVVISLDNNLFSAWQQGQFQGDNFQIINENTFRITSDSFCLNQIHFNEVQQGTLFISFMYNNSVNTLPDEYTFFVSQFTNMDSTLQGQFVFSVADQLLTEQSPSSPSSQNNSVNPAIEQQQNSPQLFVVYPNPFSSTLNIELKLPKGQKFHASIIDLHGRTVYAHNGTTSSDNMILQITPGILSEGVYFVKIQTHNSHSIKKVILIKE